MWTGRDDLNASVSKARATLNEDSQLVWKIVFESGDYFGNENTFYPMVTLNFHTKQHEDHYHVPLLLGPWSYTTYRGS